jgi:hypothetical protein
MPFSIFGVSSSDRSKRFTFNNENFFELSVQNRIIVIFNKIINNSSTTQNIVSDLYTLRYDLTKKITGTNTRN